MAEHEHKQEQLAERFEEHRTHLRAAAYRMLGSLSEADDAVQETWLRLSRADTESIENLGGWLTTVVGRVCLNMLRSRRTWREESLDTQVNAPRVSRERGTDPEYEALLADSVGLALLVVLDTLAPAERIAFVLHDMFTVPFEEIAPIVGRSPAAVRQVASRARRRVRGAETAPWPDLDRQREVVDAFLSAARIGDLDSLIAVLDPDIVLRSDRSAVPSGAPTEVHGAREVAKITMRERARAARPMLINGNLGIVVAPRGRLLLMLDLKIEGGKIVEIDVIADPERLRQLDLAVLGD